MRRSCKTSRRAGPGAGADGRGRDGRPELRDPWVGGSSCRSGGRLLHAQEEYIMWAEAVVFYTNVILKLNLKKVLQLQGSLRECARLVKFVAELVYLVNFITPWLSC